MDAAPTDPLADFPTVVTIPVQWGDHDAFDHVNNTVYLRWFESARVAYFEAIGLRALMASQRIGPILASVTCHYRRPVTYPDTVRVGARVTRIGRTSLTFENRAVVDSSGTIAADGHATVVVLDYRENRPHPVPPEIRAAVALREGRSF